MTEETEQTTSPLSLAADDSLAEVVHDLKMFVKFGASSLFDVAFIVFWFYLQFVANKLIDNTALDGLDMMQLWVLKILLAITTLVPVLAYVAVDSTRIILQAWTRIRSMKEEFAEIRQKPIKAIEKAKND